MTPAAKLLKAKKIQFSIHEYEHDHNAKSFGLEAAEKLGLDVKEVFKTLLVRDDKHFFVAILPVHHQLNLKKVVAAFQCKKMHMADPKDAERLTGYLVGSISPIGQKKQLKTVIDASAQQLTIMYVSGGKRGLDIGLAPSDLAKVLNTSVDTVRSWKKRGVPDWLQLEVVQNVPQPTPPLYVTTITATKLSPHVSAGNGSNLESIDCVEKMGEFVMDICTFKTPPPKKLFA